VPQLTAELKQSLLEAIDEGLTILGESSRDAIYFHLQSMVALKREDVPDNLELFAEGLRRIFGEGAKVIEQAVVTSVCKKLKINEVKGATFLERMKYAVEAATADG